MITRKYYLNNNSWGEFFGRMKLYDENKTKVAKIRKHKGIYTILNNNDEFILRLTTKDDKFYMSFDPYGKNIEFELARRGKFNIGLGLGHFVLVPFATISYGAYYGVSKMGDIYAKRNGLYKYVYIDDTCVARVRLKKTIPNFV